MFLSLFNRLGWTAEFHNTLVTTDPQLTQHLFMDPGHNQTRSRWYKFSSLALPGLHGILNMDGDEWKEYTRVLLPIFHATNVEKYSDAMFTAARRHVEAWKRSVIAADGVLPNIELREETTEQFVGGGDCLLTAIRGISMEILFQWAYALDMYSGENEIVMKKSKELARSLSNYGNIVGLLAQKPLALIWNYYSLIRETWNMRRIVGDIADKLGYFQHAESCQSNLFSRMVHKMRSKPDIACLTSAVNHVHGAHKAAGFVLLHALHELCQPSSTVSPIPTENLDTVGGTWWRDRLREEWQAFHKTCNTLSLADITEGRLPLTQAVLWEVQRLHPVSLGVVRRTGLHLKIGETVLPPGCEVVVVLQSLHTNPKFWSKPMEFRPERWLTPEVLTAVLERASGDAKGVQSSGNKIMYSIRQQKFEYEPSGFIGSALTSVLGADRNRMKGTWPVASAPGCVRDIKIQSSCDSDCHPTLTFDLHPPENIASISSDGHILAPQFSFVPFLYGVRMCAGKTLAEMELVASLIGILERVDLKTEVEYFAHVHGVPICTGAGQAQRMRELQPSFSPIHMEKDSADPIVYKPGYNGRMLLRLEDDMYAGVAGTVPFTVTSIN